MFPDVEVVICELLESIASTYTFLPDNWEQSLPAVQVNRVGGSADSITDVARVQVAVYAESRAAVWALAQQIRETVRTCGGTRVNGVLIDWAREAIAGQQVPDIDPDDRRVISTFEFAFRRHFA